MDILYVLVPLSAGLVLVIIGIFAWALHRGQFDDVDDEGQRILEDEAVDLDPHQAAVTAPPRESAR